MRGMVARRAARLVAMGTIVLIAVSVVTTARAQQSPPPWVGGTTTVSAFEARTSAVANEWIAAVSPYKRPVFFYCAMPEEWIAFMQARGHDPNNVWGLTFFDGSYRPLDFSALAPQACLHGNEFVANPAGGRKTCQLATRTVYDTVARTIWRTKTVKRRVRGRTVRRRVTYPVNVREQVPRDEPVYGTCPNWHLTVLAIHTLQHELQHMTGFFDEALTDCIAIQTNAWMAYKLSGDAQVATDVANEMWALNQAGAGYPDPRCHDGGPWDVAPNDPSWPVPRAGTYALARGVYALRGEYSRR